MPDLEERLARYVAGDMNALDDGFDYLEKTQQPIVMNRGERQVRAEIEEVRPTLDPVTQKLWDDWREAGFNEYIGPHLDAIERNFKALTTQIRESIDSHNTLVQDLDLEADDATTAHNRLVESVGKIRDSVKADVAEAIRRLDRNFITEIAELRAKTLVNLSEDNSVMKDDVIAVVRANVIDGVREAAIKATSKEMHDTVKSLVDELSQKDRQALVNEVRASLRDELLGEVRGELSDEFVQMREAAPSELRTELLA